MAPLGANPAFGPTERKGGAPRVGGGAPDCWERGPGCWEIAPKFWKNCYGISGVWLRNSGCLARNVGCLARLVGCLAHEVGCLAPLLGKSPLGVTPPHPHLPPPTPPHPHPPPYPSPTPTAPNFASMGMKTWLELSLAVLEKHSDGSMLMSRCAERRAQKGPRGPLLTHAEVHTRMPSAFAWSDDYSCWAPTM